MICGVRGMCVECIHGKCICGVVSEMWGACV